VEIRIVGIEHCPSGAEIRITGSNPFDRTIEFRVLPDESCPPDERELLKKSADSSGEASP
jgi:hypothetical protein